MEFGIKKLFLIVGLLCLAAAGGIFWLNPFLVRRANQNCTHANLERIRKAGLKDVAQCYSKSFGGWIDAPWFEKAVGIPEKSVCQFFETRASPLQTEKDNLSQQDCGLTASNWSEAICQEYELSLPEMKCYICNNYPYRTLWGISKSCTQAVLFNASRLKMTYVSAKSKLEIQSRR